MKLTPRDPELTSFLCLINLEKVSQLTAWFYKLQNSIFSTVNKQKMYSFSSSASVHIYVHTHRDTCLHTRTQSDSAQICNTQHDIFISPVTSHCPGAG